MTQHSSANIGNMLKALLDASQSSDLSALRAERLGEITSRKQKTIDATFEVLDELLAELEERTTAVTEGTITPPAAAESTVDSDTSEVPSDDVMAVHDTVQTPEGFVWDPDDDDEDDTDTGEMPAPDSPVDIVLDQGPSPGWQRSHELLFDDALRLFKLGDSDGALVSLERLLASCQLNDDLQEFVKVNEERLMEVYEVLLGPWEKVPLRIECDEPLPDSFFHTEKIVQILALVDGTASLSDIFSSTDMSALEVASVLSQLIRARAISTEATTH